MYILQAEELARGGDEDDTHLQLTEEQLDHLLRLNDYFNIIQQNNDVPLDDHNIGNLFRLNDAILNLRSKYPHLGQGQLRLQMGEDTEGIETDSGPQDVTDTSRNLIGRGIMPGEREEPNVLDIYANVEYSLSDHQRVAQEGGNVSEDDNQANDQ